MSSLVTSGHSYAPAPLGGRRGRSAKKLRLVKKKTVRNMLKKMGMKMRGGDPTPAPEAAKSGPAPTTGTMGGRRRKSHGKSHRKSHRRGKSLFGMRF